MDMTMKLLSFRVYTIMIFIFSSFVVQAQENEIPRLYAMNDEIFSDTVIQRSSHSNEYDRRIHSYRKAWNALIPTHTKLQYAGGMGLFSGGIGWDYGKRGQWETDILLGVIPRYSSKHFKFTLTLKQSYIPWSIYLCKNFNLEPLECGLYFNTVFSDKFWTKEPERYPQGYYGFSNRVRTHVFIGQRLKIDIPEKARFSSKSLTLFYEISTCDLYVASAFRNSYLKPEDYLSLSLGMKFQIF